MKKFKPILLIFMLLSLFTSCEPYQATINIVPNASNSTNYYEVSFITNGGSSVSSRKVDKFEEAPVTKRNGYIFDGWYLDEGLTTAAIFPMQVKNDMKLYAKWLKVYDSMSFVSASLKFMSDYDSSVVYYITPSGFDLDRLEAKEYSRMDITVSYDVYYRKDYDVLFDIGYIGSPRYEFKILNSDGYGKIKNDIETTKEVVHKTESYTAMLSDLRNNRLTLEFSTDNIQNVIHIYNIIVTFECY